MEVHGRRNTTLPCEEMNRMTGSETVNVAGEALREGRPSQVRALGAALFQIKTRQN